jgi:hypothetical protein
MKTKLPPEEKQKTTELNGIPAELESTKQLAESVDQLQQEILRLKEQLQTLNRRSATRTGIVFAIPGILSIVFSIISQSQVLAFIGLGLTFWGALFYLVRPIAYVRGSFLSTTATTYYQTIDRIIRDLGCKGKPIYFPPYPKEVYLPQHLKGLKEAIAFIPLDAKQDAPSIEEMATSKFITKNPRGVIIIPPGSSFQDQFEAVLRTDITKMSLEDLATSLPQLLLENFQLAKEIEMKAENHLIILKITDSVYKNLYRDETLKSVTLLGDPLVSAVACTIAKATGKQVTIQTLNISPDAQTLEATLELREG